MAPHTPIFKPNAALTAPEIQRLSGFGCAGPYRYLTCTSQSPGRRMHCIEGFANGVRWREGERLVPHRGLPLPNPPTWHRSPCSPD
jgi:hypothetical protein